jgi:hypothetical protein
MNVNFVIQRFPGSPKLLDCGTKSLARTTAFVESCKALGSDFEFVVDSNAKGQCYVPMYETSDPDGDTEGKIISYVPIRYVLCDAAFSGKSLNFPYCMGKF